MRCEVRAGLRFEDVGDEIVVLDASGGTVHRLDGESAEALRLVLADEPVPADLERAVDGLRDAGIVEEPAGWSRRKALLAGGVGVATAATGFFSMSLPAAALASSCPGGLEPGAFPLDAENMTQTFNMAGVYNVQIGHLDGATTGMVTVQVWGGGGGGGQGGSGEGGGGGGGGGFTAATLNVVPCTVYPVVVGAGGAPGDALGGQEDGTMGMGSAFLTAVAGGGMQGTGSTGIVAGDGGAGGMGAGMGGFDGGTGGTGSALTGPGGGGGAAAGIGTDGADAVGEFGGMGAGGGGSGADGAYLSGAATGSVPGGGGGGGGSENTGQPSAGGSGQVTISLA